MRLTERGHRVFGAGFVLLFVLALGVCGWIEGMH